MKDFNLLDFLPHGEASAIRSRDLEKLTNLKGSVIRRDVNNLRAAGKPIASSRHGYYIATNPYDITATINNLQSRRDAMDRAIKGLMLAKDKLMFEDGVEG